jgi:ketosteroid isomerase-like protein
MTAASDPLDLVARLIGGIETGDLADVRSLYGRGAVIWTCFDDHERDVDSSLRVLEWLVGATTERRYEVTRRIEIDGGVLQQHVLHATTPAGRTFSMPACLVIRVEGDHITRIDEYLDPKPVVGAIG